MGKGFVIVSSNDPECCRYIPNKMNIMQLLCNNINILEFVNKAVLVLEYIAWT